VYRTQHKAQTRRAATEHRAAPEPPRIPTTAPPATLLFPREAPHPAPPQAGDSYQACPHVAAVPPSPERHFWKIPGREPWIVLCPFCQAVYSLLRSVEIQDATCRLAPDAAGALGVSSVSHCAPGDYVIEPSPSNPTAKPPSAALLGKLLQLRPLGRDPAWLPLVDKALRTLTELVSVQQQQAQAREALRLQRMELKNRALEHVAKALQSSTTAIEALNAIASEREHALQSLVLRLAEATREPGPARIPRAPVAPSLPRSRAPLQSPALP